MKRRGESGKRRGESGKRKVERKRKEESGKWKEERDLLGRDTFSRLFRYVLSGLQIRSLDALDTFSRKQSN